MVIAAEANQLLCIGPLPLHTSSDEFKKVAGSLAEIDHLKPLILQQRINNAINRLRSEPVHR